MRAITVAGDCVLAMGTMLTSITFDRDRMESSILDDTMATHEALKMTLSGTTFRDAYRSTAGRTSDNQVMTAAEALQAYGASGHPGRADVGPLKKRLATALDAL